MAGRGPILGEPQARNDLARTIIRPRRSLFSLGLPELWEYRELLFFFTWRDVKVRYKQAVLGVLWALINPFLKMVVFSVIFGRLVGVSSEGYPYPIFLYAGLLPWQFFSDAVTQSGRIVVGGAGILKKVYFPRLMLPVSAVGASLVDFALSFAILGGLMIFYGFAPGIQILTVLPLTLLTILAALSVGILISGLNAIYRDFRYVAPVAVQIWLYVTPVIYPVSIVPERFQWILRLNPLTGIIDAYRYAVLGRPLDWTNLVISLGMVLVMLFVGLMVFRRMERHFADVV